MQDSKRARSTQKELGVSSLGGCRAQAWLQLQNSPKVNETDSLAAMMGTAIHESITKALNTYSFETFKTEWETSYNGMVGHMDWYWEQEREVVDLKTMKKKNAAWFPKEQQRWQVQTYAYFLIQQGFAVDWVTLVAIMRDGNKSDILEWRSPYEEVEALAALAWLEDVKSRTSIPAPEMPAETFCKTYCPYFGGKCSGLAKKPAKTRSKW